MRKGEPVLAVSCGQHGVEADGPTEPVDSPLHPWLGEASPSSSYSLVWCYWAGQAALSQSECLWGSVAGPCGRVCLRLLLILKSVTYRKTDSLSDNGLLLLELLSQLELNKFRIYFPQDSTFTFKDVAPQWQSFNVGRLLDVENGVRYMAQYLYGTLNVTRT